MLTNEQLAKGFTIGEFEVLPGQGVIRRGDEVERPMPKVFALLMALARRDGNLVSFDELIEEVWEGRIVGDEAIQQAIKLLRKHFKDTSPFRYVENIQKRGYRLMQPVELHADQTDVKNVPGVEEGRSISLWKAVTAVVFVGFVAVAIFFGVQRSEPAVQSLAVLPVKNLSGDPATQYMVDGTQSVLAHRLSELSEFTVKIARDVSDGKASSIAAALAVESLLEVSLQQQDAELRMTWLITRDDDSVIGAGEVVGTKDRFFKLQEALANSVRDELAGRRTPKLMTKLEPDSVAYDSYMRGMYALQLRFDGDNLNRAIELLDESTRLDPAFGPAYVALATAYALLYDYQGAPLDETQSIALETIEKGIAADKSIEDAAGAIYGFVYHRAKEWEKSEAAHQRAVGASVVDSNAFSWYSRMLASVGRLEDARDMALRGGVLDPDNAVINSRIAMAFTWLGNSSKAREYFERANELGATGKIHVMAESLLLAREGEAERSMGLTFDAANMAQASTDWIGPVYFALSDPAGAPAALAAVDRAWEEQSILPDIVLVVRSLLGDPDGAMEIARLLELPGEAFAMEILFIPELAALRQHDEFMPLLERLGIVAYWEEAGCRWDGERVHCNNE